VSPYKKYSRNIRRHISLSRRLMVFALDSYQCVYCGAFAQKQTLDHVVPVRDMVGMPGSIANSVGNLVTACLDCNRKLALDVSRNR
jgi:5-methylcytosine-specific restriction endonuclease McrA